MCWSEGKLWIKESLLQSQQDGIQSDSVKYQGYCQNPERWITAGSLTAKKLTYLHLIFANKSNSGGCFHFRQTSRCWNKQHRVRCGVFVRREKLKALVCVFKWTIYRNHSLEEVVNVCSGVATVLLKHIRIRERTFLQRQTTDFKAVRVHRMWLSENNLDLICCLNNKLAEEMTKTQKNGWIVFFFYWGIRKLKAYE